MLEMLVRNRGKLVGREELLKEVWGPTYAKETHYLRVYLAQLRRKLEEDPLHPCHLLTEAGMGYRFQVPVPTVTTETRTSSSRPRSGRASRLSDGRDRCADRPR